MAHKYKTVVARVVEMIVTLESHDALPSERELMGIFGVSRMTVRTAIRKLIDEGRVYSVHGSGTYVGSADVFSKTPKLTSFTEDMINRGLAPSSRVLGVSRIAADKDMANRLGLLAGEECTHLRRLRLADNHPMAIEDIYIPRSIFDLGSLDLGASLYAQLASAGHEIYRAEQEISSTLLDIDDSRLLEVTEQSPALCVERVTSSTRGQQIEFARTLYRADLYTFQVAVTKDMSGR